MCATPVESDGGVRNVRVGGELRLVEFATDAVLEAVRVDTRPSRQFEGHDETVHVVRLRWPDGTTEERTDRD